jgi:hypothetical protein
MKGKVIYVDFASKARKVAYIEAPNSKNLFTVIKEKLKKTFNFSEEPIRSKKEVYSFKRMV